MSLKEECLRAYRKKERENRWRGKAHAFERLVAIKEAYNKFFDGMKAKIQFKKDRDKNPYLLVGTDDKLIFTVSHFYAVDSGSICNINLVQICETCGTIINCIHNIDKRYDSWKYNIGRYIVESKYEPFFTCFQCKKELTKSEKAEEVINGF